MFLKKSQFTRNGKSYTYYKIVTTYKDEAGRSRHKLVKHLGRLSEEEADNVRRVLKEQGKRLGEHPIEQEAASITYPPQAAPLFALLDIQLLTYEPFAQKEWNVTEADMLLIVREGTGELFTNGKKVILQYGLAIYAPTGSGMHVVNTSSSQLQLDRIAFDVLSRGEEQGTYRKSGMPVIFREPIQLQAPYRVLSVTKELEAMPENGEPQEMFRRQLLFYTIMDTVSRNRGEERHSETQEVIVQAVQIIHDHYRDDLTRDRLAEQLGVSPEHFSRLFKREKGMSFIDYLLHLRIEKSRELLVLSKLGVNEIAQEVGFQSQYYFSRKFKQLVGVSPSAYVHQPKKYVSLDAVMSSTMLTLGVVPRAGILNPWMMAHYESLLGQAEFKVIEGLDEGSIGDITDLQPDLIFSNVHKQDLDKVRKLGPVAAVDLESMDWREHLRYIADVVGKQREAESWLQAFDHELAETRRKLAQHVNPRDTFIIMKVVSGKMYIYGDLRSMGGPMVYQGLQLPPPRIVKEQIIDQRLLNHRVPLEKLGDYAADHIFLVNYESNWLESAESFKSHPSWKKFRAVRKNQVYEVDRDVFYGFDPLSLQLQVRSIAALLSSQM